MKIQNGKKIPFSFAPIDNAKARRIIYLVVLVLLVAAGAFKVKPNLDNEKKLQADTVSIEQQTQAKKTELANLRSTQEEKGTQAQNLSRVILKAMPQSVENEVEVSRLASLASYTGVRITDTTFAPPAEAEGSRKMGIQLSVSGNYEGLLRFLGGLNNMTTLSGNTLVSVGPIWSVDQINFSAGAAATTTPDPSAGTTPPKDQLTMSITGSLYMAPLDNPASSTSDNPSNDTTQGANP